MYIHVYTGYMYTEELQIISQVSAIKELGRQMQNKTTLVVSKVK